METHCKLYAGATGAGTVSSFPLMLVVADPPPQISLFEWLDGFPRSLSLFFVMAAHKKSP